MGKFIRGTVCFGLFFIGVYSANVYSQSDIKSGVNPPPPPTTDGQKAGNSAAGIVTRYNLGEMIGGRVGNIISGGALGTGIGVFLNPSEIGCGEGESCAKSRPKKSPFDEPQKSKIKAPLDSAKNHGSSSSGGSGRGVNAP